MAAATLVRDKQSNLKEVGWKDVEKSMEYEFAFPYQNEDLGSSLWQLAKAYQIAVLVGPSEDFNGVNGDTWMSDQIYISLGGPPRDSIYHPPSAIRRQPIDRRHHSPGGTNDQKVKTE